jgi:hypothetical protein
VKKKNGDIRLCVDYRKVNDVTMRPLLQFQMRDSFIDTLDGAKYFPSLDLSQGYYQVPVEEFDIQKTAFTTRKGQFEFMRMPFGLCSAPATFQRLMHSVLRNENWSSCLIYLDDVLIFGRTIEEHCQRLRAVLQRFREAGLKLSPEKCVFLRQEVEYLGHIVSNDGLKTADSKTEKVSNWPTPKTEEELVSFLGLCGYYRRHMKNYAIRVAPLDKLCLSECKKTSKGMKNRPFIWQDQQENAFQSLKWARTHASTLAFPTNYGYYILDTDACHDSIGAVLSQIQNGTEKVIAYASNRLTKAEKQYCITRKELLAVYKYVRQFSRYLYGRKFTDHQALIWMLNWKNAIDSTILFMDCRVRDARHAHLA